MTKKSKSKKELLLEMEEIRLRLAEAEDTLRAIREGEVDAILGGSSDGDQIYTLQGADHPYRVFFEAMNEGAVTMTFDGTILYCNHRFADLAKVPLEKVTGMSFLDFVAEDSQQAVSALLSGTVQESGTLDISLRVQKGKLVPVNISVNSLKTKDMEAVCAIVTDLSDLVLMRRLEEANKELAAINEALRTSQEELRASERKLKDSRMATLNIMEDSVVARKRTEEINVELREKIAERKRAEEALRESNEELNRFNLAMAGREVRMIELKKEINELCAQAGQQQRYPLDFEKEENA